jgi:translation initiation factor 4A
MSESLQTEECKEIENWDDLDIKNDLLRGIYSMGFEKPSHIQKQAIYPMIQGRDIIGQAQSGTEKTGTFSISTLQRIDTEVKSMQAIIMAPTHELANQITAVIKQLGSVMKDLVIQTLVGGSSLQEDIQQLKQNVPHILIGTPGRMYDLIKRGHVKTRDIRLFVIDEADEMLSTGFKEQIYNIFQNMPSSMQVAIFSATMPPEMLDLTTKFMTNPVTITMKSEELNLACIEQFYVALYSDHEKFDMLKQIFEFISISQCIIYVNNVNRVVELYNAMKEDGFSVCCIHSSMSKLEREAAFVHFKTGGSRVLISSNITARGIDIQQVSVVINFDIPKCVHTYLHRIGRSGRWGRKGMAINFVTKYDIQHMKHIENHYKINMVELPFDGKTIFANK